MFNEGQVVLANKHKAVVKAMVNPSKYLVEYLDGKGSDYMPAECLSITDEA